MLILSILHTSPPEKAVYSSKPVPTQNMNQMLESHLKSLSNCMLLLLMAEDDCAWRWVGLHWYSDIATSFNMAPVFQYGSGHWQHGQGIRCQLPTVSLKYSFIFHALQCQQQPRWHSDCWGCESLSGSTSNTHVYSAFGCQTFPSLFLNSFHLFIFFLILLTLKNQTAAKRLQTGYTYIYFTAVRLCTLSKYYFKN